MIVDSEQLTVDSGLEIHVLDLIIAIWNEKNVCHSNSSMAK